MFGAKLGMEIAKMNEGNSIRACVSCGHILVEKPGETMLDCHNPHCWLYPRSLKLWEIRKEGTLKQLCLRVPQNCNCDSCQKYKKTRECPTTFIGKILNLFKLRGMNDVNDKARSDPRTFFYHLEIM